MATREKASEYFEQVVTPAISELIEEYRNNGYDAGVHTDEIPFEDNPPIAETHGIWMSFPDGTQKRIAVCWPEGSDWILIDNIKTLGANQLYLFEDADKDLVKEKIKKLIGKWI